ncbi:curlin minor subunit [Escherichia coli]|nr:curlin minor subunit [Escherichia coli]
MYDQVQGDNMKNKLLFMMLTILGAPGIAAAAGYDLANSEYNFAVNELSKSSFNQAAIIGQAGTNNSAQLRQGGSKLLAVVAQEVVATGQRLTRQEIITLHILIRRAVPMMPVFRKVLMVILR